jgi:hypothetical protein
MDNTEKGKGEGKREYCMQGRRDNPEMTKIFYNIVVEEIDSRSRPLGTLDARGYKNLEKKFFCYNMKKIISKSN